MAIDKKLLIGSISAAAIFLALAIFFFVKQSGSTMPGKEGHRERRRYLRLGFTMFGISVMTLVGTGIWYGMEQHK